MNEKDGEKRGQAKDIRNEWKEKGKFKVERTMIEERRLTT